MNKTTKNWSSVNGHGHFALFARATMKKDRKTCNEKEPSIEEGRGHKLLFSPAAVS
jgi:hypothetical protein